MFYQTLSTVTFWGHKCIYTGTMHILLPIWVTFSIGYFQCHSETVRFQKIGQSQPCFTQRRKRKFTCIFHIFYPICMTFGMSAKRLLNLRGVSPNFYLDFPHLPDLGAIQQEICTQYWRAYEFQNWPRERHTHFNWHEWNYIYAYAASRSTSCTVFDHQNSQLVTGACCLHSSSHSHDYTQTQQTRSTVGDPVNASGFPLPAQYRVCRQQRHTNPETGEWVDGPTAKQRAKGGKMGNKINILSKKFCAQQLLNYRAK